MTPGRHDSKAKPAISKRVFHICVYSNRCILIEVVLILAMLLVGTYPYYKHELRLATTHQPERLTELYFPDSQSLPSTYMPREKLTVRFAIHNLEYRTTAYPFQIILGTPTRTLTAYHRTVTLKQGQTTIVSAPITVPMSASRLAVNVLLTNKNQAIHFWLEKQS